MIKNDSHVPDNAELFELEEEIASIRSRILTLHARAGERAPILKGLREEISEIKGELQRRKQESNPENFFARCCGVIVDQGNANTLSVRFTPMHLGRKCEVYNLILRRSQEKQWLFSYCDLPYSIKFLPDTIFKAKIFNKVDLANFIRKVQHQVQAHVVRRQQYEAAEDLVKGLNMNLYPSYNTLHASMQMTVNDANFNDAFTVMIHLTYKPDAILPEEVSFKFDGGSEESHIALKKTMSVLQKIPLCDALKQVFLLDSEAYMSESSEVEKGNVASQKKVIAEPFHKTCSEGSDHSSQSFASASTLPVHPQLLPPPVPPQSNRNIHQAKHLKNSNNDIPEEKPKKRPRRPLSRQCRQKRNAV